MHCFIKEDTEFYVETPQMSPKWALALRAASKKPFFWASGLELPIGQLGLMGMSDANLDPLGEYG